MTDAVSSALQVYQSSAQFEALKLAFAHECVERVRHLLEDETVARCLDTLGDYVKGQVDRGTLDRAASEAATLANQHQGSRSLDGVGHAAVSASYAVANALAGRAVRRQTTPPTQRFTAAAGMAQSAIPSRLSPNRPGSLQHWKNLRTRS